MGFFNATKNIIGQAANLAKNNQAQATAVNAQQQPFNSGSIMGGAAGAVNTAMQGFSANPNSLKGMLTAARAAQKTQQMNPKATGNNATVKNVFGQEQVPGSYNRSMSALPQTQEINPILPPTTSLQPAQPPADVQQAITPTYDLSNI